MVEPMDVDPYIPPERMADGVAALLIFRERLGGDAGELGSGSETLLYYGKTRIGSRPDCGIVLVNAEVGGAQCVVECRAPKDVMSRPDFLLVGKGKPGSTVIGNVGTSDDVPSGTSAHTKCIAASLGGPPVHYLKLTVVEKLPIRIKDGDVIAIAKRYYFLFREANDSIIPLHPLRDAVERQLFDVQSMKLILVTADAEDKENALKFSTPRRGLRERSQNFIPPSVSPIAQARDASFRGPPRSDHDPPAKHAEPVVETPVRNKGIREGKQRKALKPRFTRPFDTP